MKIKKTYKRVCSVLIITLCLLMSNVSHSLAFDGAIQKSSDFISVNSIQTILIDTATSNIKANETKSLAEYKNQTKNFNQEKVEVKLKVEDNKVMVELITENETFS